MTNEERRDPRKPTALQIRFKSASIAEFVEKHAKDISRGGIFIKMKSPFQAGTLIKFEVRITEESMIHGVGRVAWCRQENKPDAPAGMGVKFIKIDEKSRPTLEAILAEKNSLSIQGDEPQFDDPLPKPKLSLQSAVSKEPEGARRSMVGVPKPSFPSPTHPSDVTGGKAVEEPRGKPTPPPSRTSLADKRPMFDKSAPPIEKKTAAPPTPKADDGDEGLLNLSMSPGSVTDGSFLSGSHDEFAADVDSVLDNILGEGPAEEDRPNTGPQLAPKAPEQKPAQSATVSPTLEKPLEKAGIDRPDMLPMLDAVPPKRGDTTTAVVIIVLLLAAASGGAWYFLTQRPAPAEKSDEATVDPPPSASIPAAPIPAEPTPDTDAADTAPSIIAKMGTLTIETVPIEATVFINGKAQPGKTPMVVDGRPLGENLEIKIQKFGFESHTAAVTPTEESTPVSVTLKAVPKKLVVDSEPKGATVWLAGKELGKTPLRVSKGTLTETFEMRIRKEGYSPYTLSVKQSDWLESEGEYIAVLNATLEKNPDGPLGSGGNKPSGGKNGPDLDATAGGAPTVKPEVKSILILKPEPEPEVKPEPELEPEPEVKPEPEPEPEVKPEIKSEPEPPQAPDKKAPETADKGAIEENPF